MISLLLAYCVFISPAPSSILLGGPARGQEQASSLPYNAACHRAAGEAIARGHTPQQGGKVIEGLRTAGLLEHWATAHGHDLPIVRAVAHVCAGEWTPQQGVTALMGREAKAE